MGFCSWFRGAFITQTPKSHHAPKPQLTHSKTRPPSTPRTRYSPKPQGQLDPLWTPSSRTATATTNSSRSHRRRPKRPTSQMNTPTKSPSPSPGSPLGVPLSRSASAPTRRSRSATPSVYPRPETPQPAHKPYRHMERELRSTPERSRSQKKHQRHKSLSSLEAIPMKQLRMDRKAIKKVVSRVSEVFNHFPFVLSGLSAMVYWGYEGRFSANVTIICPESSREAIRGWAKVKGLQRFPDKPDQFGIEVSKGVFQTLRVKFIEEDFEELHILRSDSMKASVLSLAGLANQLAEGYVNELATSNGARQEAFAADMIWVLKRIAKVSRSEHWLTPQRCPQIWDDNFWEPFTLSFPDSVPLFGAAGFRVGDAEDLPPWDTRDELGQEEEVVVATPSPRRKSRRGGFPLSVSNVQALNEEHVMRF
ncbi:hypothetical protein BGZ63DRAFT_419185 [Mariannaea sp. PMI_226]|nr:hypothetical protein BGZ63DRAFT_419185 [Mariannaea sp. PMI_226]